MEDAYSRRRVLGAVGSAGFGLSAAGRGTARASSPAATDGRTDRQGTVVWERAYGGGRYTAAATAVAAHEGGTLLVGRRASRAGSGTDGWVAAVDDAGVLRWETTYTGGVRGTVETAVANDDGTYLLGGGRARGNRTGGWIAEIDDSGTVQWERTVTDAPLLFLSAVPVDGGYVVLGRPHSGGVLLTSITRDGTVRWTDTQPDRSAFSIVATGRGTYFLSGQRHVSEDAGRPWIAAITADGERRWERTLPTNGGANESAVLADGTHLLAGWANRSDAGDRVAWLARIEPDGSTRWHRTLDIGADSVLFSAAVVEGTALVAGSTGTGSDGDAWLASVDGEGGRRWTDTYGTDDWDRINDVAVVDGGVPFLVGGQGSAGWLAKYDLPASQRTPTDRATTEPATETATSSASGPGFGPVAAAIGTVAGLCWLAREGRRR